MSAIHPGVESVRRLHEKILTSLGDYPSVAAQLEDQAANLHVEHKKGSRDVTCEIANFFPPMQGSGSKRRADAIMVYDLTLEDARSGRIWQATNATIIVRRTEEGVSLSVTSDVFNGTDNVAEMQLSLSHSQVTGQAAVGVQVSGMPAADIALQSPVVSWLSVLDAPISGAVRTEAGLHAGDPVRMGQRLGTLLN